MSVLDAAFGIQHTRLILIPRTGTGIIGTLRKERSGSISTTRRTTMSDNSSILSGKPMTRAQEAKLADNIIAMLRKLNPSSDDAQRIITRSNELTDPLGERFLDLGGMRYRNEEAASTSTYPAIYKPKPICKQLLTLVKFFPDLDPGPAYECGETLAEKPGGAESYFVWPWYERVAKSWNYAVEEVLDRLSTDRNGAFTNWRKGKMTEKYLRLYEPTKNALSQLRASQTGDFLIVPAQFGLRHRGRSVRRVREIILGQREFGAEPFGAGIQLLTHPERLQSNSDLFVDCPGAEYDYDAVGSFLGAPCFDFGGGGLRFSTSRVSGFDSDYGSSSAFLPQ